AREKESRALAAIHESLSALPLVKAFGLEPTRQREFLTRTDAAIAGKLRVSLLDGLLGSGVQLLCATGTAIALVVAIQAVQTGKLTTGQALMALHYIGQIYSPLRTLGKKWASLQTQMAGLDRALTLLNVEPEVPESADPRPLAQCKGEISFDEVTFGYDARRPILNRVDLRIRSGERVGIVGETGSGKSTLLSLLLRLYDPADGTVHLDGTDIREYRVADLRNQVAVVFQETTLFSGTIAENIAVGRPGATESQIDAAAQAAQLGPALSRFPDGLQTEVGERGQALSGGERQRIGIARALLRNAPILVLDEPTSAVDRETEAGILETLNRAMQGKTVLLVTHRETALVGCDRVVRVVDG
ncbi:MAG: ABC transporter ATP-binding protein, partial [Armatimonadaceae bacterium]